MDQSYEDLKKVLDRINSGESVLRTNFHNQILGILGNYGIRIRQDDGADPKITISYPTTLPGSIVVGLRYTKQNGTKTEDHFIFQAGNPIEKCYGNRLAELMPEYIGTHKLQR
ncbi:hypothetical protein A2572_02445 [Candidatus Collierbacteria bacterium RIFOXYD1_FULL_40_9]|uniref:Uncharacterized protein n=1 Tax=Candidatus Collierbacteria bacterium RIFOXYD1_FULL_40_9 TaxID=1817731 RepID=A0A1F5FPC9_9BACT|nr:MAG: hypothetical protein A2572_02445 [Candidatus Collierbacteria bacterium RIFOXYD1_FULL_40_9]